MGDVIKGGMLEKKKRIKPESWVITLKGWKEVKSANEIKTKKLEMEKETGRKLSQKNNGTK